MYEILKEHPERERQYSVRFDASMYSRWGDITPSGWQKTIVGIIEEHLNCIGSGEKTLLDKYGVSWILLSTHIVLSRRIDPSERLTARTWGSGVTPPVFRRDFEFFDADGIRVAWGATFSALFSVSDRRLCTDRRLIMSLATPPGEQMTEASRRAPRGGEYQPVEGQVAKPSMIDGMGHVNNTRYGDFAFDAITEDTRKKLSSLERMDIWFISEINEGETFLLERKTEITDGKNCVSVRGKLASGAEAFVLRLTLT